MAQTFRTAFNGFHKEDVVRYLDYLNHKHQNQVNQLQTELDELYAQQQSDTSADDATVQALQAQNQTLQAQNQALLAQVQALESRCGELAAQQEKPQTDSRELDAYRRAEQVQKEAQQQVELLYFQANHILTEASNRLNHATGDLTQLTDAVMGQITQLQVAVSTGKQALQEASSILSTLRPNR